MLCCAELPDVLSAHSELPDLQRTRSRRCARYSTAAKTFYAHPAITVLAGKGATMSGCW